MFLKLHVQYNCVHKAGCGLVGSNVNSPFKKQFLLVKRGRGGGDRMVVGFMFIFISIFSFIMSEFLGSSSVWYMQTSLHRWGSRGCDHVDLQLPVQSVPITPNVVSSNPVLARYVYSIQHYVIRVCQWFATDQWFSTGTPVSSTNKTDCHDITETLLIVALKTKALTPICHELPMITLLHQKLLLNCRKQDPFACLVGKIQY